MFRQNKQFGQTRYSFISPTVGTCSVWTVKIERASKKNKAQSLISEYTSNENNVVKI